MTAEARRIVKIHKGRFWRCFYAPGDYLARRTTARTRRAIGMWLFLLWIGPGTVIWLLLANELWFVGFMSLYAIWRAEFAVVSAETPTETE